ncbi:class A beta-lactamase [Oleiagrimonas soli]|uniref:Beta-lactamase n=1 Tax=Oleiagrimonas soli TaxID=1543381 RepID=A0A099CXZ0_9GAMM|nr:class A beta-lactamase [Oleiagrimonas soli]KGI78863.1 beta-lactamase [Oleiagrimonas soli]MBB6184336.1 beta-lactamase class A [Oleiagrimonas soli]
MLRRELLKTLAVGAGMAALPNLHAAARDGRPLDATRYIHTRLAALEARHGGRLGVAMLDTSSGLRVAYRADRRFLMCSTHKVLTVAALLARVDSGVERLQRRIVFDRDAVLDYAPITRHHVGAPGMTLEALCEAAITVSDNTADNLLLETLGGPSAVTAYARSLGDRETLLVRNEPALNLALPDDPSDTTTPQAMLADLRDLLLGDALRPASRQRLLGWMRQCSTGTRLLRAGLPSAWHCADKTGRGAANEINDIGLIEPPKGGPLLVAAYYAGSIASDEARESVLADVGRLAVTLHG